MLKPPEYTVDDEQQLGRAFGSQALYEKFVDSVAIRVMAQVPDATNRLERLERLLTGIGVELEKPETLRNVFLMFLAERLEAEVSQLRQELPAEFVDYLSRTPEALAAINRAASKERTAYFSGRRTDIATIIAPELKLEVNQVPEALCDLLMKEGELGKPRTPETLKAKTLATFSDVRTRVQDMVGPMLRKEHADKAEACASYVLRKLDTAEFDENSISRLISQDTAVLREYLLAKYRK